MVVVDGLPAAVVIISVGPSGPVLQTSCAEGVTEVKDSGPLSEGSYDTRLGVCVFVV